MTGLVETIKSRLEELLAPFTGSPRAVVSGRHQVRLQPFPDLSSADLLSTHRTTVEVLRKPQPYWQENGWQRTADGYEGCYHVNGHRYKGRVTQSNSALDFYIIDPPAKIRRHPCFRHRGNGSFWVHWHGAAPQTVSSGIMSVEYKLRTILA